MLANNMKFPSQINLLVPPDSSTKLGMFLVGDRFLLILPLPTLNHAQQNVEVTLTAAALSTVQQQKTVTVISIRNVILRMGSIRITPSAGKVVIQDIVNCANLAIASPFSGSVSAVYNRQLSHLRALRACYHH